MDRNLNGGEGNSANTRRYLLRRRRPRNPIEEEEMLGEFSDSEQQQQQEMNQAEGQESSSSSSEEDDEDDDDEDSDSSDSDDEDEGEDMECDYTNPNAPLPNVNREVIVASPAAPVSVTVETAPAPAAPPAHAPEPEPNDDNADGVYVKLYEYSDILDCFVCLEPLCIPVFQCENGHFLCSPCCCKVGHKCPFCQNLVGHMRCRAIEKVLESVKVECPNAKHGCKEKLAYNDKREHEKTCSFIPCAYAQYGCNQMMRSSEKLDHEKTCAFVPCSCPHPDCKYLHNSAMLDVHFKDRHFFNRIPFNYGEFVNVSLRISKKFVVLQARSDGKLFVICNDAELEHLTDHAVFLSHVGPNSLVPQFNYEIKAYSDAGSRIDLPRTFVEIHSQGIGTNGVLSKPKKALHVPYEFFSVHSRLVDLQVRIAKVGGN